MKPPTLDDVVATWSTIPVDERAARLTMLKTGPKVDPDAPVVVRWTPAARKVGVTTRCLRKAAAAAGVKPVTLDAACAPAPVPAPRQGVPA